jgi:hypothetical protein
LTPGGACTVGNGGAGGGLFGLSTGAVDTGDAPANVIPLRPPTAKQPKRGPRRAG